MNRVLITGANGFVGRHTIAPLLALGYDVHATTRATTKPDTIGVTWHTVNLLDTAQVHSLIKMIRPTHLLHLAWDVSQGYLEASSNYVWELASLQLLREFIMDGGRKAVFAGSSYDINSYTYYGVCKAALRIAAQSMVKGEDIDFVWGRLFQVYGEGEKDTRVIPYVINSLLNNTPACCSESFQIRDFTYVSDAADGLVYLLDNNLRGTVDIGTGIPASLHDAIQEVGKQMKKQHLLFFNKPVRDGEPDWLVADTPRQISWKHKVSLKEGVAKSIAYWKGKQ